MKKRVYNSVLLFFSVVILSISLLPFSTVGFCQIDTTAPDLIIQNKFRYIQDQQIILHGYCFDESGIQKVTVNSVNATGIFIGNEFIWQSPISLVVGYNTITVTAYDNSSNHNEVEEEFIIIRQTVTYEGPNVEIIPEESHPLNNITIQYILNPTGSPNSDVYLWYSSSSFENAPFGQGVYLGTFSGTKDILLNYTLEDPQLHVGEHVSYMLQTHDYSSIDFSEVETFEITETSQLSDTEPPVIEIIPGLYDEYNTPDSQFLLMGRVWDDSGINNVTVNGELVTGTYRNNWFDWQKTLNLTEGVNNIEIFAYDNSPNHFMSQKTIKVNYMPSSYSGPTIDLLLPTNITTESVTLNCVLNPHTSRLPDPFEYVKVFVHYVYSDLKNGSFLYGEYLGHQYYGRYDIPLTFQLESDTPGSTVSFMFWTSNSKGMAFTDPMTITLKPAVADFSTIPQNAYANAPISFDASSSSSPYGSIVSYEFNFGDENTTISETPTISHAYQTPGTYNVKLTVDAYGETKSTTKPVTVLADSTTPTTSENYDDLWHNSDFEITLSAVDSESGVADIYYKINQGAEKIVSKDGQPKITTDGKNNKLEFWSVDNAGNVEEVQVLSGIRLDKTGPAVGNLVIAPESEIQEDQTVQVLVAVSDSDSGIDDVTLSYSTDNQSIWQDVSMVLNSTSDLWQATIPGQQIWTNVNYKVTAQDVAGNSASTQTQSNSYEVIPEFSSWIVLPIFALATITIIVSRKRLDKTKN